MNNLKVVTNDRQVHPPFQGRTLRGTGGANGLAALFYCFI
jgi:hypothetical protein